jgi:hypothetical protein
LAFLERLGFGFVPGPGEHGSNADGTAKRLEPPFALGMPDKSVRCLLQWVAAASSHPRNLRGWAHQSYEPFDLCNADSLCTGFTAPLLAYAAWTRAPGPAGSPFPAAGEILAKVRFKQSRLDRKWTKGIHYP